MPGRAWILAAAVIAASACGRGAPASSPGGLPLINPAELARLLSPEDAGRSRPLVIQVGFRELYAMGRIPGAEYFGPASKPRALLRLRALLDPLPRDAPIVIYCGCCPWNHCPNIKPAAEALRAMGFKNAKALYLPHNFGADWSDKGRPVATTAKLNGRR